MNFSALLSAVQKFFEPAPTITRTTKTAVIPPPPVPTVYDFHKVYELPEDLPEATFIDLLKPLAMDLAQRTGIDPWVAMTQASHESRHGTSQLSRVALNLFGVKATEQWAKAGGKMISFPTKETIGGKDLVVNDSFRAYDSWNESLQDWARLMTGLSIYRDAIEYMRAGQPVFAIQSIARKYATDPRYLEKLLATYNRIKPKEA